MTDNIKVKVVISKLKLYNILESHPNILHIVNTMHDIRFSLNYSFRRN